jgi:hypothetical protein
MGSHVFIGTHPEGVTTSGIMPTEYERGEADTLALSAAGVTVERGYRGNGRVLRLERRQHA